jgi:hypothetical protein
MDGTMSLPILGNDTSFTRQGSIWPSRSYLEALPAIEYLLRHLERTKTATDDADEQLSECINNSWSKLKHYYDLTDSSHQIYAAATFLNPTKRLAHFEKQWTGDLAYWIKPMEGHCRDWWIQEYAGKKDV